MNLVEMFKKAVLLHRDNKLTEAEKLYNEICANSPEHGGAQHNLGSIYRTRNQLNYASHLFSSAYCSNFTNIQFNVSLINALEESNRLGSAWAITKISQLNGLNHNALIQYEEKFLNDTQIVDYREVRLEQDTLTIAPHSLQDLGKLFENKKFQRGYRLTVEELIKYPFSSMLWNFLGAAYIQFNRPRTAIEAFDVALQLEPELIDALTNKAQAFIEISEFNQAIDTFRHILTLKPNDTKTLLNLADVYDQLKRYKDSINVLNIALERSPKDIDILNTISIHARKAGDLATSLQRINDALQIDPVNYMLLNNKGNVLATLGQCDKSLSNYMSALKINNKSGHALTNAMAMVISLSRLEYFDRLLSYWKQHDLLDISVSGKFLIQASLITFLKRDMAECKKYLKLSSQFEEKEYLSLSKNDSKFCLGYQKFLTPLVLEKNDRSDKQAQDNIYHIGDSHCLSFSNQTLLINSKPYVINPRLAVGTKAFHLAQDNDNKFKFFVKNHLQNIKTGSIILLSFGEIDCRHDEGFLTLRNNDKRELGAIIKEVVQKYVQFIVKHSKKNDHQLVFLNIPAAIYKDTLSKERNAQVKETICMFNYFLKKISAKLGLPVLDIYQATADENGYGRDACFIDAYHMRPIVIQEFALNL